MTYSTYPEWARAVASQFPHDAIEREWPSEYVTHGGLIVAGWHPDLKGFIQERLL